MEVTADWHELMMPQRTIHCMRPSTARVSDRTIELAACSRQINHCPSKLN